MYVRVTKQHGFMVGNNLHVVRPSHAPQYLPDEAKDSAGFDLVVRAGELAIIQSEEVASSEAPPAYVTPVVPDKPKGRKKKAVANPDGETSIETVEGEDADEPDAEVEQEEKAE